MDFGLNTKPVMKSDFEHMCMRICIQIIYIYETQKNQAIVGHSRFDECFDPDFVIS
jgi:hypothetical protein